MRLGLGFQYFSIFVQHQTRHDLVFVAAVYHTQCMSLTTVSHSGKSGEVQLKRSESGRMKGGTKSDVGQRIAHGIGCNRMFSCSMPKTGCVVGWTVGCPRTLQTDIHAPGAMAKIPHSGFAI